MNCKLSQETEKRLISYLKLNKFKEKRAGEIVLSIRKFLANRELIEAPFGSFIGERGKRLNKIMEKTGNRNFFMAYLNSMDLAHRSLRDVPEEFIDQFLKELEDVVCSTRRKMAGGTEKALMNELNIIGLLHHAYNTAKENYLNELPNYLPEMPYPQFENGKGPDSSEDVDLEGNSGGGFWRKVI